LDEVYLRPDLEGAHKNAVHEIFGDLKNYVGVKVTTLAEPIMSLVDAVTVAKAMTGTDEEKLTSVQPTLDALGTAIKNEVAPVKPVEPADAIAMLSQKIDMLLQKQEQNQNEMAILRSQIVTP
jgi:hypothetical protein